ncbi:MAG: DNA repair protein RadA [Planctomycetota bacterium]|jgi:DNA repair protein RadA/Sms
MAKAKTRYVCQECGAATPAWFGRCPSCGEWSSLVEERVGGEAATGPGRAAVPVAAPPGPGPVPLPEVGSDDARRAPTGIGELDRVLGGGLVPGAAILLSGDPGIGKSTLVLQAAGAVAAGGRAVLYISGEESPSQIRIRAERLGIDAPSLHLLSETALEPALHHADAMRPALLIADSVQTLHAEGLNGAPGTVGQVRECGGRITALAKARGIPTVLIGHVTKEGALAGPRTLEHLVDVVLAFEGDRYQALRILRAAKNRFGATDEVGVFEMAHDGLREVPNPSAIFCGAERAPNAIAVATVQGSRPLLVEVQALATPSPHAVPIRRATGPDANRLHLICAVLRQHGKVALAKQDVFVSVAGGLRVEEPAADLGIALAVAASVREQSIPSEVMVVGELGLGGEVRPVPYLDQRLREAARLGCARALVPASQTADLVPPAGLTVTPVRTLAQAMGALG